MGPEALVKLAGVVLAWAAFLHLVTHVVQIEVGPPMHTINALVQASSTHQNCLPYRKITLNPSHVPLLVRQDLNYTKLHIKHHEQPQLSSRDPERPMEFYLRPLQWPQEASRAADAYSLPDFEKLLVGSPICPVEIVINRTSVEIFPQTALHVATAASIYIDLPRWYHEDFADNISQMFSLLPKRYWHKPFLMWFPDYWQPLPFPIITKARLIDDQNGIVVPAQYARHFVEGFTDVGEDSIPFLQKLPKAVWRGGDSGRLYHPEWKDKENHRARFMELWGNSSHPDIDVGFAGNMVFFKEHNLKYFKPPVPIKDQLRHRYLVSLEGEDVASGLRWMLYSNSVVLMAPPRREIWSLEGQLKPWVHYVPLRPDFRDLYDQMLLCEAYLDRCEQISRRATKFIQWFSNHERNWRLGARRMQQYLDNVQVTLSD